MEFDYGGIFYYSCDDYNRVHWVPCELSMSQQKKIAREDGEKVYYQYYAIMGTRVRVVAGYRAFSAFILLRREKALGVFFLFFVSLSFFEKNSALRKYRVSRQRIVEKSSTHSEMDAWRNAQRRNTSDLPVMAKYLRMSNGRCVYVYEKQKKRF